MERQLVFMEKQTALLEKQAEIIEAQSEVLKGIRADTSVVGKSAARGLDCFRYKSENLLKLVNILPS